MRKPYIIAEMSCNHLGSLGRAMQIVDAAASAGASAIKFQTFTPEQMVDPGIVIKSGPWAGREALDLYREAHTPREWHEPLFKLAQSLGIEAFSSVFHPDDVAFLEKLGCPRYKIASFEITDLPLIRCAAATGKPMIISTGMATLDEIVEAGDAAYKAGCEHLTFLKCTSAYPAPLSECNLATLRPTAGPAWGLSDHTLGMIAAITATARGATAIEKHLTLSRSDGGPDAGFSAEPHEFKAMVQACREAAEALGEVRYGPTEAELPHLALRRPPGGKRLA